MSQFLKKILSKKLFSKTLKNAHQGETISIQILRGKVCSNQLVQNWDCMTTVQTILDHALNEPPYYNTKIFIYSWFAVLMVVRYALMYLCYKL